MAGLTSRGTAAFGAFDGVTSAVGVAAGGVWGGLAPRVVVRAGLGLAVAATIGMAAGQWLADGTDRGRLGRAGVMAGATLAGSLVPVLGFLAGRGPGTVLGVAATVGTGAVVAVLRPERAVPSVVRTFGLLIAASLASAAVTLIV